MRIALTSLSVDDQDKAERFYVDMLGFVVKHSVPMGPMRYLTVVSPADPDGVELSLEPGGQRAEVATFQAWMRQQGIPAIAFHVDDVDVEHHRLSDQGVVFTQPPAPMGPIRAAVLDDTCGNLIMLYSNPATAA
ncbi:VOC family protein [Brevundimonas naejangsanensis]|uniref:VOC family protein n=1 Tax=Brevundimonas naejangsanensis TaxID=588932 RepID=A0A494RMT6_9CAUL|nr:VOC family protein [Brevundimonas naejangsanensis]